MSGTTVVVLAGETHSLAKHPAAVGAAVTDWLNALFPRMK